MAAKNLTAPPAAERYLARHVVVDGRDCGLAVVSRADDDTILIEPFTRETPATLYLPGTLHVTLSPVTILHEI